MARLTAWAGALLLLVCASLTMRTVFAAWGDEKATLEYFNVPATQQKGGTIRLQAAYTIHDFSNAIDFYCGFTNQNITLAKTNFGATGIRFKQQRPSSGRIKWGMSESREYNRVIWKYKPEGYAATVGKTYTIRAVVKLEPNPKVTSYMWRVFCEAKYADPGLTNGSYPFRVFKTVNIVDSRK